MNGILNKCKFEYIFAILVLLVLAIALFVFSDNDKIVIMIVTVFTSSVASVTTFFFTKHIPGGKNNE